MTKTLRRLLVTLGALAILELGARIPLPGIRLDLIGEGHLFDRVRNLSILSLGIMPYLSSAALVMLLSGLIAPLRRLREGDESRHQSFHRIILVVTAGLALLQGIGVAEFWIGGASLAAPHLMVGPWTFRFLTAVTLAAGAMLTLALVQLVTRRGLGNGIAVIFLVAVGQEIFHWLGTELATPLLPAPRSPSWTLFVLIMAVLVVVLATWLRARHPLTLTDDFGDLVLDIPLRPNLTGTLPLMGVTTLIGMLGLIPGLGPYIWYPVAPWWTWVIRLLLVAGLNLLFTAWLMNPDDLRRRAARWGFRTTAGTEIDGLLMRMFWPHTVILWLVMLSQPVILMILNVRPEVGQFFGAALLVNIALILELWRVLRPRLARDQNHTVCMIESRVWLEPALAHVRLEEAGIDSRVEDDRLIGVTGSRAPWEICKPRFPAFFNYPHLGGGRVRLLVAPEARERAEAELARWQ